MDSNHGLNLDELVAIDTHVHIESQLPDNAVDDAARKYFGAGEIPSPEELVDYYRTRKIACVAFSVDEQLTGRGQGTE